MTRTDWSWWPREGEEPDPRWSLANERTFLAYNRTALALLVGGLAVSGSRAVAGTSVLFAALGLPFIAIAAVVAAASTRRLIDTQRAMRLGQPLPAPPLARFLPVSIIGLAAGAAVVAAIEIF